MRRLSGFCVLLVAATASAEINLEDEVKVWVRALKAGAGGEINSYLNHVALKGLEKNPLLTRDLCAAAAGSVRKSADAGKSGWPRLARKLVRLSQTLAKRRPKDPNVIEAYAEALLCRARLNHARGHEEPADWRASAQEFARLHTLRPDNGRPLLRAAAVLQESLDAKGVDRAANLSWCDDLCTEGLSLYGKSEEFKLQYQRVQLIRVSVVARENPKEAKAQLQRLLDELRPKLQVEKPSVDLATLYNDAVSLSRTTRGLKLKVPYKTVTVEVVNGDLLFDLPLSHSWRFDSGRGDRGTAQQIEDGEVVREIEFRSYEFDSEYAIGDKEFGGKDAKRLAQMRLGEWIGQLGGVKKAGKVRRGKLSRAFGGCYMFQLVGNDDDGLATRVTVWVFNAKRTKQSFGVELREPANSKLVASGAALLESIREPVPQRTQRARKK